MKGSFILYIALLFSYATSQGFNARVQLSNRTENILGTDLHLASQIFHCIGHHPKSAPCLASAFGFHRRVESNQTGLQRNFGDRICNAGNLFERADNAADFIADHHHRITGAFHGDQALFAAAAYAVLGTCHVLNLLPESTNRLCAAQQGARGILQLASHARSLTAHQAGLFGDGLDRLFQVTRRWCSQAWQATMRWI